MNYKGGLYMKNDNIVKRLQKEGYKITFKKWEYWDSIPHVQLDGFEFAIAEKKHKGNWQSCQVDFIYNEVLHALTLAKDSNPILLKKIKQVPSESWYYGRYLILSMEDYYLLRKNKYPYNESWEVLQRLNREFK